MHIYARQVIDRVGGDPYVQWHCVDPHFPSVVGARASAITVSQSLRYCSQIPTVKQPSDIHLCPMVSQIAWSRDLSRDKTDFRYGHGQLYMALTTATHMYLNKTVVVRILDYLFHTRAQTTSFPLKMSVQHYGNQVTRKKSPKIRYYLEWESHTCTHYYIQAVFVGCATFVRWICLLWFYAPSTSKVISGWAPM